MGNIYQVSTAAACMHTIKNRGGSFHLSSIKIILLTIATIADMHVVCAHLKCKATTHAGLLSLPPTRQWHVMCMQVVQAAVAT